MRSCPTWRRAPSASGSAPGIRVLRDVGVTQLGMLVDFGSLPQAEIMRSLEIFANEVLPHVRDL